MKSIINEARTIPINLTIISDLKARYQHGHEVANKIFSILKNCKIRGSYNGTPADEATVNSLIREATELKVMSKDIEDAINHKKEIDYWKNRILMRIEDEKFTLSTEELNSFISESSFFKWKVSILNDIERNINCNNWLIKVKYVLQSPSSNPSIISELLKEGAKNNYPDEYLKILMSLLNEIRLYLTEVENLLKANHIEFAEIKKLFQIGSGKFRDLPETIKLGEMIQSAENWRKEFHRLLEEKDLKGSTIQKCYEDAENIKINVKEFDEYKAIICPNIIWINKVKKFLQEYSKEGNYNEDEIQKIIKKDKCPFESLQKRISNVPQLCQSLEEYAQLKRKREESLNWAASTVKFIELNKRESSEENLNLIINHIYCPRTIPLKIKSLNSLLEIKNTFNWVKKSKEILEGKFAMHNLEQIIKEGNAFEEKSQIVDDLINQISYKLTKAKNWIAKLKDFKSKGEITSCDNALEQLRQLIEEGKTINVKMKDLDNINTFILDLENIKKDSIPLLKEIPTFEQLEEFTEMYANQGIAIPELELISKQYKAADLWKNLATFALNPRKIIRKKPASVPIVVTIEKSLAQNTYRLSEIKLGNQIQDLHKETNTFPYCICREYDVEGCMVGCDNCEEWFHIDCLRTSNNISKEEYYCISCVQLYDFPPNFEKSIFEEPRVTYQDFIRIYEAGLKLGIKIPELEIFDSILSRLRPWIIKAQKEINLGIDVSEIDNIYIRQISSGNELNSKKFKERNLQLKHLYLESQSFPFIMEESDEILQLIKTREWIFEAYDCMYKNGAIKLTKKLIAKAPTLQKGKNEIQQIVDKLNILLNKKKIENFVEKGLGRSPMMQQRSPFNLSRDSGTILFKPYKTYDIYSGKLKMDDNKSDEEEMMKEIEIERKINPNYFEYEKE